MKILTKSRVLFNIVTCMLMQKTQLSGAQTVLSCTWENATDGNPPN